MRRATRFFSLFLLTFLVLVPPLAVARNSGRITGKVMSVSGDGLLGAVITIFKENPQGGTISFTRSDKNGVYSLANLTPGTYYLQVSREGYNPLTSSNVKIEAGRPTTMNVVLQEFIDIISGPPDSRNWDLRTVLRSTSDRRLIFRDLPGSSAPGVDPEAPFSRAGVVSVASGTGLGSDNYALFPGNGQSGITSNFAYVEPLSYHGRMIFSGQAHSGYDSAWQVRNTYNYRPDPGRDFKISVGYGRLSLNGPIVQDMARPTQFLLQDPSTRETGVQTLGIGFEAHNKVFDVLELDYGFDLSRVYYGTSKSLGSPFFQVTMTPATTWVLKTALASRRLSDNNSLTLPGGDVLNLTEPTYIARIDGEIYMSQFRHAEISAAKILPDDTTIEVGMYQDRMQGPGLPFLVSTALPSGTSARLVQLREDQTPQHGMRLAVNRRILDYLSGSIAYVYGTGTNLSAPGEATSSDMLARSLLNLMQRSYYHTLTGQMTARFPRTNTSLAAVVRWYPGYSLTPIDLFADRLDILTKGVNFSIRQPIPLPEFMGTNGRWEALVDVRNLFDQSRQIIPTSDGQLVLARNPRSLRFGINLNLY
jgi:hypothetical protein